VILLDTNALIWLLTGNKRIAKLPKREQRYYVSPVSLLELRFLNELGRIRFRGGDLDISHDPRIVVDDPSAVQLFEHAWSVSWTRDPFDRLIVAHASLRGWRIATSDANIVSHLGPKATLEL
jgi:PIN domain nuclease of toxin-antitoxin system